MKEPEIICTIGEVKKVLSSQCLVTTKETQWACSPVPSADRGEQGWAVAVRSLAGTQHIPAPVQSWAGRVCMAHKAQDIYHLLV